MYRTLSTARLAYSFGLGLALDTFVLVIRTSGLNSVLVGIDQWTVYGTIAFGLVCLVASISIRRRITFLVKPRTLDFARLGVLVIQGVIILLYFEKYPIFPEYQSPDYVTHVQYAQSLISGSLTTIPDGILYFGIHLQLAVSLLLSGVANQS